MLTLRFREEITQTEKEMFTYITSLVSLRESLLSDIEKHKGSMHTKYKIEFQLQSLNASR
jgi:hypothetical protein